MSIIYLSDIEDYKKFLLENPKVVADFYASWCGPCRKITPIYEEFSQSFPDIKFLRIDVEKVEEIIDEVDIECMPTFIFYENGKEKKRIENSKEEELLETLKKMGNYNPLPEPTNIKEISSLEEYEKITKENKLVVVDFFEEWCPPCQFISPFYKRLARNYPDVLFLKIEIGKLSDITEKEEIQSMPTFIFYYKCQRNRQIIGADKDALEYAVKEYVQDYTQVEGYKYKYHEHELKKVKRYNCSCEVCEEAVKNKDEVYFCLDCQYTLCQYCREVEEGKKPKKEFLLEPIKNKQNFEEIMKTEKKVALYYVTNPKSITNTNFINMIEMFKAEYPEIKFYKIKNRESTKDITENLNKDNFSYYNEGVLIYKTEDGGSYKFNTGMIKLSNRQPYETFHSSKHPEHPLIKVNHTGFRCDICHYLSGDKMETIFRCNDCDFDYCLQCKGKEEKEKNEQSIKENNNESH